MCRQPDRRVWSRYGDDSRRFWVLVPSGADHVVAPRGLRLPGSGSTSSSVSTTLHGSSTIPPTATIFIPTVRGRCTTAERFPAPPRRARSGRRAGSGGGSGHATRYNRLTVSVQERSNPAGVTTQFAVVSAASCVFPPRGRRRTKTRNLPQKFHGNGNGVATTVGPSVGRGVSSEDGQHLLKTGP